MKRIMIKTICTITMTLLLGMSAVGCTKAQVSNGDTATTQTTSTKATTSESASTTASVLDTSDLFSNRDLEQSADLTAANQIKLENGKDVTLDKEGVYVLSGEVKNVTVMVDAPEDAKVQIVLDGVSITNEDSPAIYVKTADKVFVTSTNSKNHMEVSGSYVADGDTNLDAVIFSKADITLNGTGTLDIVSSKGNGISSKDDLEITGGVYNINSSADAIEAKDAILINDGTIAIDAGKDALHSENADDASLGYIYIKNGTLNITAADDGIRANSVIQIDGGNINIKTAKEGIESTQIKINDGQITLYATDDGINAAPKVNSKVFIEVNGGNINVTVGSGDTDGFDADGDLYINGGTIAVTATSAFDSDNKAQLNGGTVTVNGQKVTEITQQQMGGHGGKRK